MDGGYRRRAKRFGVPRRSHSGGGTERAAHLVESVFPDVPVRQWVLTLPPLSWDLDADPLWVSGG